MLEAKTLTIKKSTNKSGQVVNFIPEMVDGKEVYSVVNKNNDHCGYITEALFNLLMEQDPEEKENKALYHRAFGVDEGNYSLTIDSSILNNAQIFLTREDNIGQDVATTISTSEISTFLRANGLKAVRNSVIVNGDFNKVDEINDSVCEFVSLDGKDNKILNGYNSVDGKENINMGQAINDLEIL